MNILVIRPDAIGDVILTLPLISALRQLHPHAEVTLFAQSYMKDLDLPVDALIPAPKHKAYNLNTFLKIRALLKKEQFDRVILPYLDLYYALIVWSLRIPVRIGDKNQLIPSLFLNRSIKLNYRNICKHVVEQNLALVNFTSAPKVSLSEADDALVNQHLSEQGWKGEPLIVIQPCTGGSDQSWPWKHYVALIREIHLRHPHHIVLTGAGENEERVMDMIDTGCSRPCYRISGFGTLGLLKSVLKKAELIIGTNTGPLHLAAFLKTPVLSLFLSPKIKPLQWAPWKTRHICCRQSRVNPLTIEAVTHAVNAILSPQTVLDETTMWQHDFAKSNSILFSISSEQDSRYFKSLLPFYKEIGLQVIVIDANRRIKNWDKIPVYAISKWNLFKLFKLVFKYDVTVIHAPSSKLSILWSIIRHLAALKLYVPPIVVTHAKQLETPEALVTLYCNAFEKG